MNTSGIIDWEKFRRHDRSLDLYAAWRSTHSTGMFRANTSLFIQNYFTAIEVQHLIRSRQVAALALENANMWASLLDKDFSGLRSV